ncbi:hypothetical protein Hanom_Chr01g00082031 [Helianthus anomalus]
MTFSHPSHQPPPIDDLQPHQSPLSSSIRRPLATGLLSTGNNQLFLPFFIQFMNLYVFNP